MQHYIATYWNGTARTDLHDAPLTFREAEYTATSAMLKGCGTTRLRLVDAPETPTGLSAEQLEALHACAARYGQDGEEHLFVERQCGTASSFLYRLRNTRGPR